MKKEKIPKEKKVKKVDGKSPKNKAERKEAVKKEALRLVMMLFGCVSYALSIYAFLVPNGIVAGGITGLSTAFHFLFGLPIGLITICLNIPILIFGLKTMGWRFILHCFITTATLGIMTDVLKLVPPITSEPILAAMYGGLLQGIGIGIFIKFRVSSGGTELLGRLTRRILPFGTIALHIAVLDGIIVVLGAIVTQSVENVLYALILIFVSSKVSDLIVYGFTKLKMCYIITDKGEELSKILISSSPRGVTILNGVGAYSEQQKTVLMTCVRDRQVAALKITVRRVDPQAFVIICESKQALGKGFDSLDDDNKV